MELEFNRYKIAEVLSPEQIHQLDGLRQISWLKKSFETGWIAGGFVRHLLLGGLMESYFSSAEVWSAEHWSSDKKGDIDFFFPDSETANAAVDKGVSSQSMFALNIAVRKSRAENHVNNFRFNVQFVNHPNLCKPTAEDTIKRFDFLNCMVAIEGDEIIIPAGWRDIENAKLIKINSAHSPFLGSRIIKYLTDKGLEGITDDSFPLLREWFASIAGDKFENFQSTKLPLDDKFFQGKVKTLRDLGLVSKEDLIFFINKWRVTFEEKNYGQTVTVTTSSDWALTEMVADNSPTA